MPGLVGENASSPPLPASDVRPTPGALPKRDQSAQLVLERGSLDEDPTAPGVVLVGDAAGHNDPITGQGLAIALRDVRLVSEPILAGRRDREAFQPYARERLERMLE